MLFKINKKLITLIMLSILCFVVAVCLIDCIEVKKSNDFKSYTGQYNSPQHEIYSYSTPTEVTTTNMSELYSINNNVVTSTNVNVVGTINIMNATDLYAFSALANKEDRFLSYNYQLLSNIDYNEINYDFIPIAWNNNKYFNGTFNGNGYEISNLSLLSILSGDTAYKMEYYAMFSKIGSGALVTNFGLRDTNIVINGMWDELKGVAVAVGYIDNGATVSYLFSTDLRDPILDESGITASGGHRISGLVFENNGLMLNCYSAYNIVSNYTIDDYIDFTEILMINSGEIEGLYFYNETISEYTYNDLSYTIVYKEPVGKTLKLVNHYGEYCESLDNLNKMVSESSINWFTASSYNTLSIYLNKIITPITRGITVELKDGKYIFKINNERDFSYMFELMNLNDNFASDKMVYEIYNDLNLSMISEDNYYYSRGINSTIKGVEAIGSVELSNGKMSPYPTIYYASINNSVTTEGIDAHGVFSWLTGSINDLNFVLPSKIEVNNTSSNLKAIGIVAGYVDGGKINNVNVYADELCISNSIGKYYLGGICGILSGEGEISNSTASGKINNIDGVYNGSYNVIGYMNGSAIGGLIGYITNTMGSVKANLSVMNITTVGIEGADLSVGGVIGAGYTYDAYELENQGNITAGSQATRAKYLNLYVSGVIGRHLGLANQINRLTNQGDIKVYSNNSNNSYLYLSGIENADIITSPANNLSVSRLKSKGKFVFYASSLSNSGSIEVYNTGSNLEYTSGINIFSKNGFESTLSGIYNLGYKKINGHIIKLDKQEINMSNTNKYAPAVNTINTNNSSNQGVTLSTVYNLRSYNFVNTANINSLNLLYSGCVLGSYINYTDVRNEGDLSFSNSYQIGSASNKVNIKIVGLFNELNSGYKADTLFNDGNIEFIVNSYIYGDIFINGICYSNRNGFNDNELKEFNPSDINYNNNKIGSLNNVINNGDITCTSTVFANGVSYTSEDYKGINGQQTIGTRWTATLNDSTRLIKGNINCAGITYINESVITNTFNLGDIFAVNYINEATMTDINAGGISILNIGKYAYIENSANNGNIKAMNLSSSVYSNVNAAGITVRNDKLENGSDYTGGNNHAHQLIAFTINYGGVYSYNYCENITDSSLEAACKSAGILAMGLCNIINTVNYGNIYGSETTSGIFGIVYFSKFSQDVSNTNKVNLANSINYGNVYVIEKGTNNFTNSNLKSQTYNDFINMSDSNKDSFAKLEIILEFGKNTFSGSIFSIINFNNDRNAENVSIRYLISFLENTTLVGAEASTPSSINIDVSKMYSAYYKFINGYDTFDKYMGKQVIYSPLSTGEEKGYVGVFSDKFTFRQAIEGKIELDLEENPTDQFITDYFQFVAYQKINSNLLDKIGWRTIAYFTAANDFAQNLEAVSLLLSNYKNNISYTGYTILVEEALDTASWMQYCSDNTIYLIVEKLLKDNNYDMTLGMLEYLLDKDNPISILIDSSVRKDVVESLITELEKMNSDFELSNYIDEILNYENGFSSVMADILLSSVNSDLKDYLTAYIENISINDKEELLDLYINYLYLNDSLYFNYSNNEAVRLEILEELFNDVNDEILYKSLILYLDLDNIVPTDEIKMYSVFKGLTSEEKMRLFSNIIVNNSAEVIHNYLNLMSSDIEFYQELINNGYSISSVDEVYSLIDITNKNVTNEIVINERVALYNQIKNTQTFRDYLNTKVSTYYALATEHNNTFQSTTAPSNNGAYSGELTYAYTESITPSTYFYGPYTSSSGGTRSFINPDNVGNNIANSGNTAGYYSIFTTTDLEYITNLYNQGIIYNYGVFYYEFGASGTNNQMAGENYFNNVYYQSGTTDFSGTRLVDTAITFTDNTNTTYTIYGGTVSAFKRTGNTSTGVNTTTTAAGTYVITDTNNKEYTISSTQQGWVNFIRSYGVKYYIAYVKSTYHSTQSTGIYKYSEPWGSVSANYFTWKSSSTQVYTSQYIDYSVDDLLLLDGVLTGYDGKTLSNDERNIINNLFNTYFASDSNNFKNIIEKALFESLGQNEEYINSFIIKNIYSSSKINNKEPFEYLNINSNTTVKDYLLNQYVEADYKEKLIYSASSNKNAYIKLLERLIIANNNTLTEEDKENILGNIQIDQISDYTGEGLELCKGSGEYQFGLTFNTLSLTIDNTANRLILVMESTNSSSVLTITDSLGNTLQTIAASALNEYVIDSTQLPSNIILNSNKDIIVYKIYQQKDISSNISDTSSIAVTLSSNTGTFINSSEIENIIYNSYPELTNLSYTVGVTARVNITSSTYYVRLYSNNTYIYSSGSRISSGTTFTVNNINNYLGRSYSLYANRNNANATAVNTAVTINSLTYNISFTGQINNQIVTNLILYEDILNKALDNLVSNSYIDAVFNDVLYNKYDNYINKVLLNLIPIDRNTFKNELNDIYQIESNDENEILKYIVSSSNESLYAFVEKYTSNKTTEDHEILKSILNIFAIQDYRFISSIINEYNPSLTEEFKEFLTTCYIITDYSNIYNQSLTNNEVTVYDTVIRRILDSYDTKYQYINNDGTFDNDKFEQLCEYLGYSLATTGYGIYALSSSKGILNGAFIPDNIILDNMKAEYNSELILTDSLLSDWRGGSSTNNNDISNKDSVNYAVLVEMKQLIKSISTTIFTLNLIDSNNVIHHSSESTIDLENKTITYFIPQGYSYIGSKLEIDYNTLSIANMATFKPEDDIYLIVGSQENIIKVTAEDESVYSYYTIIFEEAEIEFTLQYSDLTEVKEIPSGNSNIALYLSSNVLPESMDIAPYINIIDIDGNIISKDKAFELVNENNNHIINANHNTIINMTILNTLTAGEYTIVVDIFGVYDSVKLIKNPSSEANITSFVYEGVEYYNKFILNSNRYELTSMIEFGRAFDYEELSSINSDSFYLNNLSLSVGAILEITANKAELNNIITYSVSYLVTAEDGTQNLYVHYLIEKNPFLSYNNDGSTSNEQFAYATLFKDGKSLGTYTYLNEDSKIEVEFERGYEPQYRVKYSFDNIYILDNALIEYKILESTLGAAIQYSYSGMTITVTGDLEAGIYEYTYSYISKGNWKDGLYERRLEFPKLIITKNYSIDATLHKITFLDTNVTLSGLATVITAGDVMTPGANIEQNALDYFDLRDNGTDIVIDKKGINYNKTDIDYSSQLYKDYFIVGALSNATLYDYAPTFVIEEHSEIYQYTTLSKLRNYGEGQAVTDKEILINHDTTYIYVPYTSDNGLTVRIFLIEIINGEWKRVYTDDFDGQNISSNITTLSQNKAQFTYNNKTWVIDSTAGVPSQDNASLYMDYIGTPQEDHFWYVSYVIFSENALNNQSSDYIKYYHIALIDTTNTIYFDIKLVTPIDFTLNSIYVTLSANQYIDNVKASSIQISGFAGKNDDEATNDICEYYLENKLQVLPSGYFYFYVDLPDGYIATTSITNKKINRNVEGNSAYKPEESGAYLPPSSIVTQRIEIVITISKDITLSNGSWGISVADIFTRNAVLEKN